MDSKIFTYKCPACGGALVFNPNSDKFGCEYCGSEYTEAELKEILTAESADIKEENSDGKITHSVLYNCPSCGAEIVTDETTAATYCYYCHNPVILVGRLSDEFKPDYVLPFDVDKDTAIKSFLNWASKKRYVPKSFYSKANVDKITGVYYPYWIAKYNIDAKFEGEGTNSTVVTTNKKIITTTKFYRVVRDGNFSFSNIFRNALKKTDKKLSEGVFPYNLGDVKEFSQAYLSGFMAEKRDMEIDEVKPEIEDEIKGYIPGIIQSQSEYETLNGKTDMNVTSAEYKYALLPAWVITYKGSDNKMYYYTMNGQTRMVCGILPMNKIKLLIDSILVSGAVFGLACLGGYFIW